MHNCHVIICSINKGKEQVAILAIESVLLKWFPHTKGFLEYAIKMNTYIVSDIKCLLTAVTKRNDNYLWGSYNGYVCSVSSIALASRSKLHMSAPSQHYRVGKGDHYSLPPHGTYKLDRRLHHCQE